MVFSLRDLFPVCMYNYKKTSHGCSTRLQEPGSYMTYWGWRVEGQGGAGRENLATPCPTISSLRT